MKTLHHRLDCCLAPLLACALTASAEDFSDSVTLRVEAPAVLPRGQALGEFSPFVSFAYGGLRAVPYTLKVWLLEESVWHCASSQWCERVVALDGRKSGGGNGAIQMALPFDVFDCGPSLTWVARLFDESGVEIAVARARSQSSKGSPPVLARVGRRVGTVGQELRLTFSASVSAGEKAIFRVRNAPSGSKLDATGGVFTWTPESAVLHRLVVEAVSLPSKLADAEIVDFDIAEAESIEPAAP